jgi:hypothetical protein
MEIGDHFLAHYSHFLPFETLPASSIPSPIFFFLEEYIYCESVIKKTQNTFKNAQNSFNLYMTLEHFLLSNSNRILSVHKKMRWLLKLLFAQNHHLINHMFNGDFKCHFIFLWTLNKHLM